MSSLGSTRLDRNLTLVGDLTRALLALRAHLSGKLGDLKLQESDVEKGRGGVETFLKELAPLLAKQPAPTDEYKVIFDKLVLAGEQPKDWAEDFEEIAKALGEKKTPSSEDLDKIMKVVGYLQGEAADDVRRMRLR